MEIIVATRNKDKVKEIRRLLKGLSLQTVPLSNFRGVPDVKEDGDRLEDNAIKKAIELSSFLKRLVIADDSGIEVKVLGNKPGVYSARFAGKGATYSDNNKKLLKLLQGLPVSKRRACFRCVIVIADKGKVVGVVEGKCRGKIGFKARGKKGFGYDPIFIPDGFKKTFAQLGLDIKNKISHRSKALAKAKKIITGYCSLR